MKFKKILKSLSVSTFIFVFAFLSTFSVLPSKAQAELSDAPEERFWVTSNGHVKASVYSSDGRTLYIGGTFDSIGKNIPYGVSVSTATGLEVGTQPRFFGHVNSSIPDGNGGWYVGGSFTRVEDLDIDAIVHILPNGTVDQNFNPNIGAGVGSSVLSMALNPSTNTLYFAGFFTSVGGQVRNGVASVNATTGAVTPFNPNVGSSVFDIALNPNTNILYVAGTFTSAGGQTRNRLAAIDATTGAVTAWNPNANYDVNSIKLNQSTNTLYIGGRFYNVGGQTRPRLAAIDATTGAVTAWNPNADRDVYTIVLNPNTNTLYVGGQFDRVGNQSRNGLAEINTSTSAVTSWSPDVDYYGASAGFYDMTLDQNTNTLYVGGRFNHVGGVNSSKNIVAFNTTTGAATSWNPGLGFEDSVVSTISLNSNTGTLFIGGSFTSIGNQTRNHIAAINTTTGAPTSWNPNVGGEVYSLALNPNANTLYVGGSFTTVGGQTRNRLAAIDVSTGAVTPWNPNVPLIPTIATYVRSIVLNPNTNTLYVGGLFNSVGGQARNRLAAIDASTGAVTPWNPNLGGTSYSTRVQSILLNPNRDTLYVGGYEVSASVDGQTITNLLAVNPSTGAVTPWDPNVGGGVNSIALNQSTNTLFIGGELSSVGGQTRNHLAAIDASTGAVTPWNPNVSRIGGGATVETIALNQNTNTLYVGGVFSSIGEQERNSLAAVDLTTGTPNSWNPNVNGGVYNIMQNFDNSSFAVGGFYTSIGHSRNSYPGFAVFSPGGSSCPADFNEDGSANNDDLFAFLNAWFSGNLSADANGNGTIEVPDIFTFLSTWFAGC